jgi:hypothetical protein
VAKKPTCSECGAPLPIDPAYVNPLRCAPCHQRLGPPVQTAPLPEWLTPELIQQMTGKLFNQPSKTELPREYNGTVRNDAEADLLLEAWKKEMPAVSSAYRPSGALPLSGLCALGLGALVGALAGGVLAFSVCAFILVMGLLFWICGENASGTGEFLIYGMWAAPMLSATVSAWTASWCTCRIGRWGDNCNVIAAGVLSFVSGVLSTGITCTLLEIAWMYPALGPRFSLFVMKADANFVARLVVIVTAVLTGIVAAYQARRHVGATRFCEGCKRSMRVGCATGSR